MARTQSSPLPILPLPRGMVLFPGIIQRIPASPNRPDIPALLSSIYTRAAAGKASDDANAVTDVPIVCVPMASPNVGPRGQLLMGNGSDAAAPATSPAEAPEYSPTKSTKTDLFSCGVLAKITNIEGRGGGEFSLHVEGRSRVYIDKVVQEQPILEGKVTMYADEVDVSDPSMFELFQKLKDASRGLAHIIRMAAVLAPERPQSRFTPMLVGRLEAYIANKTIADVGVLADFMANIVVASYEEKLQLLALFDVRKRAVKVLELLERQIGNLRNGVKVTTVTVSEDGGDDGEGGEGFHGGGGVGIGSSSGDIVPLSRPFRVLVPGSGFILPRGLPGGNNGFGGGMGGGSGGGLFGPGFGNGSARPLTDSQETDEIDDLEKKLESARLSPEAAKVAERELRRLRKMVPAQAEYTVVRGYLETLADIPWAAYTQDRLGPGTLAKAREQLDKDHYGLQNVKKRLLEYLAVLRLKQAANDQLDEEIRQVRAELEAAEAGGAPEAAPGGPDASAETPARDPEALRQRLHSLDSRRLGDRSPILLLVGPPGVGKTSLARSVAAALGRKFHRISLGGVRDEAEIRGHRRTYVAAMPGLIMQGLRKVGVANPVVLLDEVDKIGANNYHGDPSAAMLEVLDPEQNHAFVDHYLGLPFDLSRVLFVATANSLDTIPAPLLDRMETIHLPGYTTLEKKHIAMQYLVPKQIRANGLAADQLCLDEAVVAKVIESYTREAGVRNLERELASVCRAKAVELADAKDAGRLDAYRARLTVDDVERILGMEKYEDEMAAASSRPGVVTGLVAYSSGGHGSILFIEVAAMPTGYGDNEDTSSSASSAPAPAGRVQLTGKLGDVLKESVEVALTWVRAHAFELGLTAHPRADVLAHRNIHVHCPSGSIPKDGPSSGLAQAIALISLFSGRAVPPTLAMTGEITLRGRITAVGGIKEKLIGALRAGVKTVLLPAQNRKDVKDLPQEVLDGLEIIHVSHVWEAIHHVWPDAQFPRATNHPAVESRL